MPRTAKYEAPASYTELFEEYFGYIEAMLVRAGIHSQRVPDEAMTIITSLIKVDFLASYDQSKMWRIGTLKGKKVTLKQDEPEPEGFVQTGYRTAPFMSPFRTYVNLSIRAARDRQARDMDRLMSLSEEAQSSLLERLSYRSGVNVADEIDDRSALKAILDQMHEAYKREFLVNPQAIDLSRLASSMHSLAETNGGTLPRSYEQLLAGEYGVGKEALVAKLAELRQWLSDSGFRPAVMAA